MGLRKKLKPRLLPTRARIPVDAETETQTTNVELMMRRQHPGDVVVMGQWMETLLASSAGELLVFSIEDLLEFVEVGKIESAERTLGMIQAYRSVLSLMRGYVLDGRKAVRTLKAEALTDPEAEETDLPQEGK